ncbi:adenosylhomocysteinase [Candidatus Falkowbacteria bacterium CG_4_9_14_3_um_filter_36_9]|uniref:Adenosylhomocysteinase n=2 Tax=Candidatus Falkowiibacteriota TaxID=1752728 RepID=A0A1J4T953_9BACT|nr:MAG: adenosylhomocysteinase [Candidatus Falkowbacteria bacterium CG1_02_37_44]PIV50423.1 MAG: adenosylhomocysteinase [Candidatus Falkowbacteria bacterium CG02_land_8_20_14_3_00_36_14]PIX11865.1 MAG: adenosylhomocysteinase [Candidatus Falkowbacteria bacterium CG_4_8_14_3_um_filter_36_11]PJA11299.1 MAG: adenosylhomocysteinase [Candidatus Falkowbacteria bacterium CG_4_10_14_0_2_um_filter_36_22]PJB18704.1 MAG: adenosylhomocysteinase [Candidatus Falkowbacteria bacterium CG_4_9_14_3_um_filter_36_9
MNYKIKNIKLAEGGKKRIAWAERDMPVLNMIKERFDKFKPLRGLRISACLHVTAETANLARTLKAGGANVLLCASNPLSTQDDVAAALVKDYKIPVFAVHGENKKSYYANLEHALKHKPRITIDDGADLISLLHSLYKNQAQDIIGSLEETTTGVIRLQALAKSGKLRIPVFAINNAKTKYLFDNRYGTGQSTLDGIIRATDMLIAGKNVVVAGYGWCGRGFAMRARGMGAKVIVTEVDDIKALEAAMDGFVVMPMRAAAKIGDLFCTLTGDINVIRIEHFKLMPDGAVVCNSGHFDVEVDVVGLKKIAKSFKKNVRNNVDEYIIKVKSQKSKIKSIYLLGEGRLINLAAAEGHPASVMDMSFATQALTAEYVIRAKKKFNNIVYEIPEDIENWIAKLKLKSMGISIDKLTPEQKKYLESWEIGT